MLKYYLQLSSYFSKTLLALMLFLASTNAVAEDNEITFWEFWNPDWIKPAIEKFEQLNPPWKIKVERLTWSGGKNKLITALAAGYGPDVMEIGSTWAAEFITSGVLAPVDDLVVDLDLFAIETGRYQQVNYALPWTISVGGLYYNKNLLQQAGFSSPPTTWAELLQQSQAINKPQQRIYGFGVKTGAETTWQKFIPFAWSNGSQIVNDQGQILVGRQNFIEALTFYQQLNQAGLMESNLTVRKAFLEGRLGFIIEDPGQYAYFTKNAPQLNFGVVGLPAAPATGSHLTFGGAELLVVNKFSKNLEMAKKFIKFMVELPNTQLITNRITTLFPADKAGIKDDFYTKDNPHLKVFLDELDFTRSTIVHEQWLEMQRSLVLNVEKVLYGRLTPSEAAKELEDQIEIILAD